MKWEFFKYAEIGGTRAVVSRMCECPRCGGVHTTVECESEVATEGRAGLVPLIARLVRNNGTSQALRTPDPDSQVTRVLRPSAQLRR